MVVIPARSPAVILAEIHALRAARASGTLEARAPDGRLLRYQSTAQMILAEGRLIDEYAKATGQAASSVSFGKFTRG